MMQLRLSPWPLLKQIVLQDAAWMCPLLKRLTTRMQSPKPKLKLKYIQNKYKQVLFITSPGTRHDVSAPKSRIYYTDKVPPLNSIRAQQFLSHLEPRVEDAHVNHLDNLNLNAIQQQLGKQEANI